MQPYIVPSLPSAAVRSYTAIYIPSTSHAQAVAGIWYQWWQCAILLLVLVSSLASHTTTSTSTTTVGVVVRKLGSSRGCVFPLPLLFCCLLSSSLTNAQQ